MTGEARKKLNAYLEERRNLVDAALEKYLPLTLGARGLSGGRSESSSESFPLTLKEAETLRQAMRYSLLAGGKRVRPILTLAACEAVCGDARRALPTACALEVIHTYSLIHDDLPAMDNDDLRRGQPTCHKKFGEATAILAGDALLTEAFNIIARQPQQHGITAAQILDVIGDIAQAAGYTGMAGGQFIDLDCEEKKISAATLETLHRSKTGRLIEAAIVAGAKLGGAKPAALAALKIYGEKIGLVFQIADDILNETGGAEEMGKSVGSDKEHAKATYPSILGLEKSQKLAQQLMQDAIRALAPLGERGSHLADIARFIVERRN